VQYLGHQLGPHPAQLGPGPAMRTQWAWRNLYRPSDYIGGPVFRPHSAVEFREGDDPLAGDHNDIDRQLIDPTFAPLDGDLA
jgi:hypothetical protein